MKSPWLLILLPLLIQFFACGTPGAPQPPSLNIPKAVVNLSAIRKGDAIRLSWTAPEETTDGALVHHSGQMIVRRQAGDSKAVIQQVPLDPVHKSAAQQDRTETLTDSIASLLQSSPADFVSYTVEAVNSSGKSAGESNEASVPLVLTPPTPTDVSVNLEPAGVRISWSRSWPPQKYSTLNAQYAYRIMRRTEGLNQPPVMIKQLNTDNNTLLVIDTDIEWEKRYQYWITPVTLWQKDETLKGEVEGNDSRVVPITTHDVFPPAVPSGLQAVSSQVGLKSFIDLTWIPNTDKDLAGYNVYRRTQDTQPVKINTELVKTSAFHDEGVQPGMEYLYSISAVDLRNNESPRSQEASEKALPD